MIKRVEKITDKITLYNCDCMEYMKGIPDKYYDLAIVDPPYGIGITKERMGGRKTVTPNKDKNWDDAAPKKEYFDELFRISKNQIIWGGNYFDLPISRYFAIWDKAKYGLSFAECEYAWVRSGGTRIFKKSSVQLHRFHPTQKPVELYEWLLKTYAKTTDRIIDTHFGSCSIGIACHNFGCTLDACELDEEYFDSAYKRLKIQVGQLDLFR